MRGEAMNRLCHLLEDKKVDLSHFDALEFFAREGDWQTLAYAKKVRSLEAWEIDPKFEANLNRNLPGANIRIGDSYHFIQEKRYEGAFDWVVLDNPQNTFGPEGRYCEHFDCLPLVLPSLKKRGFVTFNINWKPFDLEKFPAWVARRRAFYLSDEVAALSHSFLLKFYEAYFVERGLKVSASYLVPRNSDYLAYLCYELERN